MLHFNDSLDIKFYFIIITKNDNQTISRFITCYQHLGFEVIDNTIL